MENCFPPAKSTIITVLDNDRLPYSEYSLSSLSMRSLLVSASSARRAEVFTPSPLLWVFSMMEQARSTKAGTVSCFSCLGISTSVQYCVSSLITSWKGKIVGSLGYYRKKKQREKSSVLVQVDQPLYSESFYLRVFEQIIGLFIKCGLRRSISFTLWKTLHHYSISVMMAYKL